jgi:uncharacterized protein
VSSFVKRWWWAGLLVAVGFGFWRLRFDVDILNLLPPDEPTVEGLKLYQKHFTNARELIMTLRAPEAEQAERLASTLAARLRTQSNLVESVAWQPPWQDNPIQLAELLGCLWFNQPPEMFSALTNRLGLDQLKAVLDQTKEVLTTSMSPMDMARRAFDPFNLLDLPALTNLSVFSMQQGQSPMMSGFAAAQGTYRLLFVQSAVDLTSYRACAGWLKAIETVVADLRASQPKEEWAGVVVRYTGRPVFVKEIAASMQHDMSGSVIGTSLIIALLFWLTHRRWLPMLWLLALLALILTATLGLGGLVLGTISVVSMGFAAILLGLAVDYAVVHYQEALAHPQLSVPEIRRTIAPSILWAAITTMSAFLVLNLGGLPGLAQLGTLVALGIGLSAWVMVMVYLPPLFPTRRKPPASDVPPPWWSYFIPPQPPMVVQSAPRERPQNRTSVWVTWMLLAAACVVLCIHRPGLDRTGNALRPQRGEAESALAEMTSEMGLPRDPLWLIVSGKQEAEVAQHLVAAERLLSSAASNHVIGGYLLPSVIWPQAEYQAANRPTAAWLGQQGPRLRSAALAEGFNTNALVLTEELLRTWARAGASKGVVWPTNQVSQWLLKRFVAHSPDEWFVMGLIYPATNHVDAAALASLSSRLSEHQALLSGWELLGSTTLKRVRAKLWLIVTPMVVLVLTSLWFAFRRATEILLGAAVLLLSGFCLLAIMALAGWSWNLLNLMAVPLMLGTGVDYTIFIQLALRRHGGDLALVRRSVGRALLLCGGTAIAGFGSLAWSSNPGMASLGQVCAVGIGANVVIAVFLLPAWWEAMSLRSKVQSPKSNSHAPRTTHNSSPLTSPSSLYRAGLWRLGLGIVRVLPSWMVEGVCLAVAELHFRLGRSRREVVVQNLLPALAGDRSEAQKVAHRLYHNFARKLVGLWRVESGVPVRNWLKNPVGLEVIRSAVGRGQGVLFITLHLGNWEHGGLLLAEMGIQLTVLTLAEPDDALTRLRMASRERWSIKTLIIGHDSFAFVEVIKRLQEGAALAISIDRPPEKGAVMATLFDRPFAVSAAAAELARASGCALIGVTIVRRGKSHAVKVVGEFPYDRRALGDREVRRQFTQQILRAFEPEIREHLDQWYQFVPVWPQPGRGA